jgi:hypothetical protein
VPVFEIFWMKNGEKIKKRQFRFFMKEKINGKTFYIQRIALQKYGI